MFQVLLYYKYTAINDPWKFWAEHKNLCESLGLTGRIIIAKEGINGTVEGALENTEKYISSLRSHLGGVHIDFKRSLGTGQVFPKLSIKVRDDIVSSSIKHLKLDPAKMTGKYLTPKELHQWIHSKKRFFIVDMRNDYEHSVGYFEQSILAPFKNFRDLPKVLPLLKNIKDETIVTVCTGGVRCEKASGFLLQNGYNNVYQLEGGIVSYMEKYPNEDFLGKLYVFDGRVTMGFNLDSKNHKVVGRCKFCQGPAEDYYDCKYLHCQGKRHFIACKKCIKEYQGYCSTSCQKLISTQPPHLNVQVP